MLKASRLEIMLEWVLWSILVEIVSTVTCTWMSTARRESSVLLALLMWMVQSQRVDIRLSL